MSKHTGIRLALQRSDWDMEAAIKRFWKYVQKKDGCWEWLGAKTSRGYGCTCVTRKDKEKVIRAHRLSWLIHNGDIPAEIIICHHCDNPGCVNPDHLFSGTPMDNTQDMMKKGRHKPLVGEKARNAKLNWMKVEMIRDLHKKKACRINEMAMRFNVSRSAIIHIIYGYTWAVKEAA